MSHPKSPQPSDVYVGLVSKIAGQLRRAGLLTGELDEHLDAGLAAVKKALPRFNPALGIKLSTFLSPRIRGALLNAANPARSGGDKDTRRLARDRKRLAKVEKDLSSFLSRRASLNELGEALEWPPERVSAALLSAQEPIPLTEHHRPARGPAGGALGTLADEVSTLRDERERQVLRRRFGLDGQGERSQAEIGAELGLSRQRVAQLEEAGLAHLSKRPNVRQIALAHVDARQPARPTPARRAETRS
jgi:DNA-directed RNA polymerase specialized sigma subunit